MNPKLSALLQSRKFWALIASLTAIWTAVYTGSLDVPAAINATVAAFASYSLGVALDK